MPIASSIAGEGKSTMAANLSLTMAQAGSRVCLIEADLRRPKVLEYMGLEGGVGLTDALIGRTDVMDVVQPYGGTNLWVLGAGPIPPNPSELLGSTAMRSLLSNLGSRFDYVVVDAPPALPVTDAVVISKLVDGAIVVAGSGLVERDQLALTLESLESVNGHVLGIVSRSAHRALRCRMVIVPAVLPVDDLRGDHDGCRAGEHLDLHGHEGEVPIRE